MKPIHAVLFDLDGTLLDTAPDLVYALNRMRQERGLAPLPLATVRSIASLGSKTMLKCALDIDDTDANFFTVRTHFLEIYQQHLALSTRFFPHMENVLAYLEQQNTPWGIVTNKLTQHTLLLLKALGIDHRPACIICGDTLPKSKPDPEPILHACQLLQQDPKHCVYIGDSATDVIASKAAGTQSLVALYGYLHANDKPATWQADGYITEPIEIIDWLRKYPAS